ncbi:hypothetical protein SUGI_0425950 [Cryptomeria japonica]|nr:hypothetical protein SUGI_0425950 [Cryptomeria japonica]
MAVVACDEYKVNITTNERNGCNESQYCGVLRKRGIKPVAKILEVGVVDPRKIIHAMKVALALSLVSLVVLLNPLYVEVGDNPIWAVMTVILVLEFNAECVGEYFDEHLDDGNEDESKDSVYQGYKIVLDSKATDESWVARRKHNAYKISFDLLFLFISLQLICLSENRCPKLLATFASWEPRHGRFPYRHPWKQYVKIGVKLCYLAYSIGALNICLRSEIWVYKSSLLLHT